MILGRYSPRMRPFSQMQPTASVEISVIREPRSTIYDHHKLFVESLHQNIKDMQGLGITSRRMPHFAERAGKSGLLGLSRLEITSGIE